MSHEIDQYADGSAAFVSAHKQAWHRLGTVLDHSFTAAEAMTEGHLGGWNVRKTPLTAYDMTDDGVTGVEVPGKYATVRTNPITGHSEALGVVGDYYQVVQNEEHAEFLDALTGATGAHLDTAGALYGGRQVFVTCKLPEGMLVGGTDRLDLYLAALNSHDGTTGFRAMLTPVRIVCANTQTAALNNAQQMWSVRHTSGARSSIEEARQALELSWRYAAEFEREAEKMIQTELSEASFEQTLTSMFGEVDPEKSEARQKGKIAKLDTIRGLYHDADTQQAIRGTRWAAYQAIVEYADHYSPVREDGGDVRRAAQTLIGGLAHTKSKAFGLLRVSA